MNDLKYIKLRASQDTPLTVLKDGVLKVKDEDKDYVKKGTVIVAAVTSIQIKDEGKTHNVDVIKTKEDRYAPVSLFDVYVDEFSNVSGKKNVVYKSAIYKENRLVKYAVPLAAIGLGLFLAHKKGFTGKKLVFTGIVSLLIGTMPYFYLKNKRK